MTWHCQSPLTWLNRDRRRRDQPFDRIEHGGRRRDTFQHLEIAETRENILYQIQCVRAGIAFDPCEEFFSILSVKSQHNATDHTRSNANGEGVDVRVPSDVADGSVLPSHHAKRVGAPQLAPSPRDLSKIPN